MSSKLYLAAAALLTATALLPASVRAETMSDEIGPNAEDHVFIGAGALIYRSPFRDEGTTVQPIPLISIRRGDFYMESLEAGVQRYFSVDPNCVPSVQFFLAGRNSAGEDRDDLTVDAGARLNIETMIGTLSVDYRHDVSGEFDGGEWNARYEVSGSAGPVLVSAGVQASRQDQATANHMYGVDAELRLAKIKRHPSNAAISVYEVYRAATNLNADVTLIMPVTNRLAAIGYVSGGYLGKPVRENPWLDRDYEVQGLVGLAYRF